MALRIKTKLKNQDGAILLIVLVVSLTVSLIGATLFILYYNVLTASQIELYRAQALYLAEAGIAKAMNMLKNQAGSTNLASNEIIPQTKLGEGYFEVYGDLAESAVIAVGSSHGVKREIQLKYSAF